MVEGRLGLSVNLYILKTTLMPDPILHCHCGCASWRGYCRLIGFFGQFEFSRVEQELFMRKLREQGVAGQSFMIPDVVCDVGNWLGVSGNLAAHRKAIEAIKSGFGLDK